MDLVDLNRVSECKLVLNELANLRSRVVESLSTPKFAKTATKLVIDY